MLEEKPTTPVSGKITGRGKYNIHIGQVWKTNYYGDVEIIGLNNKYSENIHIRFINTGNETHTEMSSLVRGQVKDRLFGVGYNSKTVYGTTGKYRVCHGHWNTMLVRAYCPEYEKEHPTYADVRVCDSWHDYQNFAEWYFKQEYRKKSFQLDKDLLVIGNKVYSEATCCFLPQDVNKAICIREFCKGYSYHHRDDAYEAFYRQDYLGRSTNYSIQELQNLYVNARNNYVRGLSVMHSSVLPISMLESIGNYTCEVSQDGFIRRVK